MTERPRKLSVKRWLVVVERVQGIVQAVEEKDQGEHGVQYEALPFW